MNSKSFVGQCRRICGAQWLQRDRLAQQCRQIQINLVFNKNPQQSECVAPQPERILGAAGPLAKRKNAGQRIGAVCDRRARGRLAMWVVGRRHGVAGTVLRWRPQLRQALRRVSRSDSPSGPAARETRRPSVSTDRPWPAVPPVLRARLWNQAFRHALCEPGHTDGPFAQATETLLEDDGIKALKA